MYGAGEMYIRITVDLRSACRRSLSRHTPKDDRSIITDSYSYFYGMNWMQMNILNGLSYNGSYSDLPNAHARTASAAALQGTDFTNQRFRKARKTLCETISESFGHRSACAIRTLFDDPLKPLFRLTSSGAIRLPTTTAHKRTITYLRTPF